MSSPTSDTTVERILTELYHSYNGAKGEAVAVTNAATALNAHYAQKMGRWLGKDEELDESDGVYSEEYHAWTDGRNSLRSEVRAKAKEEGIELDGKTPSNRD